MKVILTQEELAEAVADYVIDKKLGQPSDGMEWQYSNFYLLGSDGEAIDDTVEAEIEITEGEPQAD